MKVTFRFTVRLLLALLLAGTAAVAEDRIVAAHVTSLALGRALPIAVIVPARAAQRAAPVLFILHGRGRNHRTLLDSPVARAALLAAPFYVVLPEGEDGWYVDGQGDDDARYGSYLAEVVAWAGALFPLATEARRRGIAGWSMGGYGAVRFAETHPAGFGFVASIIGLLDFPRPATLPDGQNYAVPVRRFTADPAVWETYNPLPAIASLRDTRLLLILGSHGFERTMNENFLAALEARGMRASVHRLDGGHEFSLVERALPLVIAEATSFFAVAANSREHGH